MDQEPDVIRQQIEQTRESLADKLETLEGQVRKTIGSVTSTVGTVKSRVEDTVQAVTSAVGETVDSVKRTFDIPYQVRRHPYLMTGGALVVGAALAYFLAGRPRRPRRRPRARWAPSYTPPAPAPASAYESVSGEPRQAGAGPSSRPGVFAGLLEPLAGEFDKLKATAIGAFLGLVRDAAVRWVPPSLAPKVEEIVNDITRRAGGDVVPGPILSRREEECGGR
jgi:hypothetical protein